MNIALPAETDCVAAILASTTDGKKADSTDAGLMDRKLKELSVHASRKRPIKALRSMRCALSDVYGIHHFPRRR